MPWSSWLDASWAWCSAHKATGTTTISFETTFISSFTIWTTTSTGSAYTLTQTGSASAVWTETNTVTPVYVFGTPTISVSASTYGYTETIALSVYLTTQIPTFTYTNPFTTFIGPPLVQDDVAPYCSGFSEPTPACPVRLWTTVDCGQCTINGGKVELLWWPPVKTAQNASLALSTIAAIQVISGVTYTSPSVYISFASLFASDACSLVGTSRIGTVLALRAEDVSTLYGWANPASGVPIPMNPLDPFYETPFGFFAPEGARQLNFSDLLSSPPLSLYEDQPKCTGWCQTIYPSYNPYIAVPSIVRALDPAWLSCGLGVQGLYDPPKMLTPAAVLAGPTTPASLSVETTTPAQASSGGGSAPAPTTPAQDSTQSTNQPPSPSSDGPPNAIGGSTSIDTLTTAVVDGSSQDTQESSVDPNIVSTAISVQNNASPGLDTQARSSRGQDATLSSPVDPSFIQISESEIPTAVITLPGGQAHTLVSNGSAAVVDNAIAVDEGSQSVVDGVTYDNKGTAVIAASGSYTTTLVLEGPSSTTGPVVIVADGQTFTVLADPTNPSAAIIGTRTTLSLRGPAIMVGSDTVSLGPSGLVVNDGETVSLSAVQDIDDVSVVTIDGRTFTASQQSGRNTVALVDGTTLSIGGAAYSASGDVFTLGPSGLVVNGTTTVDFADFQTSSRTGTSTRGTTSKSSSSPASNVPVSNASCRNAAVVVYAMVSSLAIGLIYLLSAF
ncbi:hypothetical protein LTR10_003026 [Elasticomyces elasticus]|nr:hypothetical protein LTR10_003026 [Elasticomyces elasticus]KAK4967636.1 hypothetical protein LTR42_009961 [Elasticomyces elasticus]